MNKKANKKCGKGNHNLVSVLHSAHRWDDSAKVARWCKNCGAVVVDVDNDGRTYPGRGMKMIFPEIIKQ